MRELLLPVIAILAMTCSAETLDCPEDGYVQPHPHNCNLYIECENGEQKVKSCSDNQLFDSKEMKCSPKDEATCKTSLKRYPSDELLANVLLPHECKCSLYYERIDGEYVERFCDANKVFDISLKKCIIGGKCNSGGNVDYGCPKNGTILLPVEDDCSSYYVCHNGERTLEQCEFGLSFDKETESCTWPPSVECNKKSKVAIKPLPIFNVMKKAGVECPAKGSTNIPHECSCTVYYHCKDGHRYRKQCPSGLIYDYVRQVCDNPEVAVCKNSKHSSMFDEIEEILPVLQNRVCKPHGRARLSHENNCRLYYQCENGKSSVKSCLEGHYFNPLLETCDLKENTICGTAIATTPEATTSRVEDCPICADCKGCIIRDPNPTNCSQFYQCENGKKVLKDCPDGLHYDPNRQLCDYPENVNCTHNGKKEPHECQCELYYVWENGQQKVEKCPDGTLFDHDKLECVDKDDANCNDDKHTDCIGKCSSTNSTEHLPHKDCDKYCECKNGRPVEVKCPPKQFYDPDRQDCFWPEDIKDLKCDPFPCNSNTSGSNLPHECSCDLYYECRNGSKYRKECENGKSFDYVEEKCVDCEKAHCYTSQGNGTCQCKETCSAHGSSSPIIHEECNKYCVCKDGKSEVKDCPTNQYYDPQKGKCDFPEFIKNLTCNPFPCSNGPIPHECICNEYYKCVNGTRYRAFCDDGYEFDYELKTCVACSNAHCYHTNSGVDQCFGSCSTTDSTKITFLRHKDCSKFCVCREGSVYVSTCCKDKYYNEKLMKCTSLAEANCRPLENTEQNAAWTNFPLAGKHFGNRV